MPDLNFLPATEVAALVRDRKVSPVDVVEASLARIAEVNPALNAFVQLDAESALAEVRRQAEALAHGEDLGPLAGLPFGVKELENALGFRSTMGLQAQSPDFLRLAEYGAMFQEE